MFAANKTIGTNAVYDIGTGHIPFRRGRCTGHPDGGAGNGKKRKKKQKKLKKKTNEYTTGPLDFIMCVHHVRFITDILFTCGFTPGERDRSHDRRTAKSDLLKQNRTTY